MITSGNHIIWLIRIMLILTFLAACKGGGSDNQKVKVIYVNQSSSGADNGTSWTDAFADLQDALDASATALTKCEIWVSAGTYTPGTDRTDSFILIENVAVYGGFSGSETSRAKRNWTVNETILSGEIGDFSLTDN